LKASFSRWCSFSDDGSTFRLFAKYPPLWIGRRRSFPTRAVSTTSSCVCDNPPLIYRASDWDIPCGTVASTEAGVRENRVGLLSNVPSTPSLWFPPSASEQFNFEPLGSYSLFCSRVRLLRGGCCGGRAGLVLVPREPTRFVIGQSHIMSYPPRKWEGALAVRASRFALGAWHNSHHTSSACVAIVCCHRPAHRSLPARLFSLGGQGGEATRCTELDAMHRYKSCLLAPRWTAQFVLLLCWSRSLVNPKSTRQIVGVALSFDVASMIGSVSEGRECMLTSLLLLHHDFCCKRQQVVFFLRRLSLQLNKHRRKLASDKRKRKRKSDKKHAVMTFRWKCNQMEHCD